MAWQFGGRSPVYKQIVSRIRADILNGKYKPDEQVPPVRQLAMEACGVMPRPHPVPLWYPTFSVSRRTRYLIVDRAGGHRPHPALPAPILP